MENKELKLKWWVKNCKECFKYQNDEFYRETYGPFCPYHEDKEDQPPGIIKKIKETKKWLWIMRIFWGIFLSFHACLFYLIAREIILSLFFIPVLWIIWDIEKYAKKELKGLQDKKNEWIRVEKENEPKNHKTIEKLGQEVEDVRAENRKLDLSYIDFYQKEMNKQEPEATKQRKDIKTDEKINGKTIEEVLGKDWKKRFESLSGEDIIKERDRLKRLIDAEKIKETLKENEQKKD